MDTEAEQDTARAGGRGAGEPVHDVLAATATALFVVDRASRILEMSRSAERLVGRSPDELRGRAVWDVCPAEEQLIIRSIAGDALVAGRPLRITDYSPVLDRRMTLHVEPSDHGFLVMLSPADPLDTGSFAYAYRAEGDALALDWVSPGFQAVTGSVRPEIADLAAWSNRIDDRDRPGYQAAVDRLADSGATEVEYRVRTPDGRSLWLRDRLVPILSADGAVLRVHGVATDITEARLGRAQAMDRRDALQDLLSVMPVAIVGLDRDDRVTHWNQAAERTFGWTAGEVIGRPYTLVPDRLAEEHRLILQDAFQGGHGFSGAETKRKRRDGTLVDVAIWTTPLPQSAGSRSPVSLGILLDLTERKKLEQQLYQAQKMEAVGRLAGGIAHDFNNLITVVTGHSAMLLEREALDRETRQSLEEVSEAGDKAALLTRQLLAFSRRQVLQPRVISINDAIRDMERMLRRLIGEDVDVAVDLEAQLGHARVDPVQFQQVVMNLLVNARDAMPDGGRVVLRTSNARIGQDLAAKFPYPVHTGDYVLLEVSDTGSGMSEEVRARIFEPFFTTKVEGKGTGLGLSTVYGIVKQSGGYIWAESDGGGSTFSVYLPRVQAALTAAAGSGDAGSERASGRIAGSVVLLVEDESGVRALARRVLEREGCTVLEAANGDEALERAVSFPDRIDLLVSDVVMPGRRGPEVYASICETRPGLRALFMSGYSEEAIESRQALGVGASFLAKPFTPDELRAATALALGAAPEPGANLSRSATRESELERRLRGLDESVAGAPAAQAAHELRRAGDLCISAGQRERAIRYYGRAVDAFLLLADASAAEQVCRRILEVAPSVVRARRTLALMALAGEDVETAVHSVGEYVRAAMEARQSDLAVKQLRTMAGLTDDPRVREFVVGELDLLGAAGAAGAVLPAADEWNPGLAGSKDERWERAISAALAPPSDRHLH